MPSMQMVSDPDRIYILDQGMPAASKEYWMPPSERPNATDGRRLNQGYRIVHATVTDSRTLHAVVLDDGGVADIPWFNYTLPCVCKLKLLNACS